MRGIVLEGVSASGKSTVLNLVQKRIFEEYPNSTKLFISEHYTQRMLEDRQLTPGQIKRHTEKIIGSLDVYQSMLDRSKFAVKPSNADVFVTIERFLFTFLATQPNIMDGYSVDDIKRQLNRLGDLNVCQYVLVLSEDTLREHVSKTLTHRNDRWLGYIKEKGGVDSIIKDSMQWQESLIKLAARHSDVIKTEVVPVKDWNYEAIADTIFKNEYS